MTEHHAEVSVQKTCRDLAVTLHSLAYQLERYEYGHKYQKIRLDRERKAIVVEVDGEWSTRTMQSF